MDGFRKEQVKSLSEGQEMILANQGRVLGNQKIGLENIEIIKREQGRLSEQVDINTKHLGTPIVGAEP